MYPQRCEFIKLSKKYTLVPVCADIICDMDTPVSLFRKLVGRNYGYLLESVEGGQRLGRYSFIGFMPDIIFQSQDNNVVIMGEGVDESYKSEEPLKELERILDEYSVPKELDMPRFYGGAVGYIGYDMVRFFENVPQISEKKGEFPDSIFVFAKIVLIFDHITRKTKIVYNADCRNIVESQENVKDRSESIYNEAVKCINDVIGRIRKIPQENVNSVGNFDVDFNGYNADSRDDQGDYLSDDDVSFGRGGLESNFTKSEFEKSVLEIKEYIKSGDIFQAVLSQRLTGPTESSPFDIYRTLRSINPSPYMFYLQYGDIKLIGSSPEVLVRAEDGMAEVRPIAGTRPRGKTKQADEELARELLNDEKENAEHIMLVDLGRNDLGRVCDYNSIKTNELKIIENYSHVMHLVSNVKGKLKEGKNCFDLLRASFPAGTVSGAPKIRAMEILAELEPCRRGPYAGGVGYFGYTGNMDVCIAIRTIFMKGNKVHVQAGAGVVADSEPEREYFETLNKARALLKAIETARKEVGT